MALRSSSSENPVEPSADRQDSLNPSPSQRALPESSDKRLTAIVLTVIVIGTMFAPWWKTTGELLQQTTELSGWDLLILGFGAGGYAPLTGFSVFGNVLFGALTTVPLLIVAILLIVRAVKPRAIPANVVALWALLVILTIGWLMVLGWARLNATLGIFPVDWGALIAAMAMAFTAVAMWNWWRRGEREFFPRRGFLRRANKELDEAESTTIDELLDDEEHSAKDLAGAAAGTGSGTGSDTDAGSGIDSIVEVGVDATENDTQYSDTTASDTDEEKSR
ncbi:protein-disulfide reductase DsbD [Gulosibacter chungangensis]|uniref:Uncharacterized protein n=1 Tax=Gulosibacter chungangensis TaxID=979746 RepID=A0A7J5BAJ5_9MICO|nr:hypothetical protein [Gulosibacter chungangensis]KAB1643076.1 hypothetical protein F8O05_07465 [Gulosibacter chungangensis]